MMTLFTDSIVDQVRPIIGQIAGLPLDAKVEAINAIRAQLHEISPFKSEPVDFVQWVPARCCVEPCAE